MGDIGLRTGYHTAQEWREAFLLRWLYAQRHPQVSLEFVAQALIAQHSAVVKAERVNAQGQTRAECTQALNGTAHIAAFDIERQKPHPPRPTPDSAYFD